LPTTPRPPHWQATLPTAAPSLPSLGSPLHWAPAEFPMSPTPPIIAPPPAPTPPMASCALATLEAATVTPWRSPQQYLYLYAPSPVPSKLRPVPSKTCPSPPPPYGLPSCCAPVPLSPTHKWETLELATTTAIVSVLEWLEALLTNGNTQPHQQFANSTCHFCGETGHTMVCSTCMKLEQMIQQASSPSDSTPAPAAKPADKGKAPEQNVTNEQLPVTKEPITQPPIHPFSGIPGRYVPPTNRNLTAPNRSNDGAYQTMPPIYNIEQSKSVFEWVLSTKVTVLVGKLCSVSQDIRNQFRTAVMPKQLVGASTNTVQDPSNIFKDILPTFAIEEPQFSLGSNTNTAKGLILNKAPLASVDSIKAYIDLLPHGEEPVMLTVAKDSQSLCSIMMLINNKEEVECIHDSGSQIILMSTEIASNLGLSYDPNIILNMQSANGTMD
ncbi:hypothetical protein C0989_003529, partial [Termitomyces sp. Mn162]